MARSAQTRQEASAPSEGSWRSQRTQAAPQLCLCHFRDARSHPLPSLNQTISDLSDSLFPASRGKVTVVWGHLSTYVFDSAFIAP